MVRLVVDRDRLSQLQTTVLGVNPDRLHAQDQAINTHVECTGSLVVDPVTPAYQLDIRKSLRCPRLRLSDQLASLDSPPSRAGTHTNSIYEQSPAGTFSASDWSETCSPYSVGESNDRATSHVPSIPTTPVENDGERSFSLTVLVKVLTDRDRTTSTSRDHKRDRCHPPTPNTCCNHSGGRI
jgi:hypothetical protein